MKQTSWLQRLGQKSQTTIQKFFENWDLMFCLVVAFLNALQLPSGALFLQFTSRRLHWSLARAGYLLSVKVLTMKFFNKVYTVADLCRRLLYRSLHSAHSL